ncbi:MAG TPA: L,D-transpeptidase [Mycobacteriales bacterium]|nr:L,D-transpeptidase [Mycobacteriales bacterium]
MTPAHSRRYVLVAAFVAFLGVLATTLIEGGLPWTGTANAADAPGDYTALLTQPADAAAAATPVPHHPSPCAHNVRSQLVVVNIAKQHMWACADHRTVISTPVTTGQRGDATPRGSFAVQALTRNTTLHPADGDAVHVNYWIPFRLGVWGFHDASWQTIPFGSSHYRTKGSLGCVHVPVKPLRRLFDWVHYGTTVRIR